MNSDRVYELLERLAALLRAEERRLARESQLHPVHIHVLRYLVRCNRFSDNLAAIAEYLGVTKGTASETLRILKERNLVESHPDAKDRRKQHLRPTQPGTEIVERCTPPPVFPEALAKSPSGAATLEIALEELLQSLLHSNGSRPFGLCHSCCHLQRNTSQPEYRCGLIGEPLDRQSTLLICQEFEEAEPAGVPGRELTPSDELL